MMMSVDEFWFAHRIFQYQSGLPYRDFSPYKTVLGYYLLLPPMLLAHGVPQALIFTKHTLAVINTSFILLTSLWLTKFFSRGSILISLTLLLTSELMLTYSTNLRVDLLAYWLGLVSFLCLLEKRFIWAGIFIALGFLTSQKVIWYLFASNLVLLTVWPDSRFTAQKLIAMLKFNGAACLITGLYITIWSGLSGWSTVIHSLFYEAAAMYHLDWYNQTRALFWSLTLLYNPLLFLLCPLPLISLFIHTNHDDGYQRRLAITLYSLTILVCLALYKQVFPYYMQVTIPLFLIYYAAFFHWLFQTLHQPSHRLLTLKQKKWLWLFLLLYLFGLVITNTAFNLPLPYLLTSLISIGLISYLTNTQPVDKLFLYQLFSIVFLFMGGIYPACLYTVKLAMLNGTYQRDNLRVMKTLLTDGSDYVAGIELIYHQNQPIAGLRHLMGPAIAYLYHPNATLRTVMTASLYEDPDANIDSVISALKTSHVKFYVNNYRMMALPEKIRQFLFSEYTHYWGSIYLYAPAIQSGQAFVDIKFPGKYRVELAPHTTIQLAGKNYQTGNSVFLAAGRHPVRTKHALRLSLIPETVTPASQSDQWRQMLL